MSDNYLFIEDVEVVVIRGIRAIVATDNRIRKHYLMSLLKAKEKVTNLWGHHYASNS